MSKYQIDTPIRQAAFLAQVGYESGGLSELEENLNYSVAALRDEWPFIFPLPIAEKYGRTATQAADQKMIANLAYANRYGNGDVASGDGWTYRGHGLIQLTFKSNYREASTGCGVDLVALPDLLLQPDYAALAAAWFWNSRNINEAADSGDYARVTQLINGSQATTRYRAPLYSQARLAFGLS